MNAGKAVYGILSANSGVTDIVGTRIFPEIAEQEAVTPFVIYQLQSVAPEDTHDGPSKLDEVRFEFLCYADSYNEAADLGVAVRAALDRVSGTYNGVNVESVQFNDVDVEIEYDPRRYSQVLKFTFRIKRDDIEIALGTPVTGAELGDLSDVDVSGVTNGQLIAYNSTTGNWEAADDAGGAEQLNDLTDVIVALPDEGEFLKYDGTEWVNDNIAISNVTGLQTQLDTIPDSIDDLDDVKIVGTPSEGEALVYQSGFWSRGTAGASTLGDLDDVNTTGAAAGSLISYNGVDGWTISAAELPDDAVYYHNRYASEAETLRSGATETVELYYTAQADGDGLSESASSDTPTSGYDIRRKLYYAEKAQADPDTSADWTQFTAIADNTTFANAKTALLAYLKERTGGTVPISLKMTWEEVSQTAYLLDQSYGSGAEAAYSTRQLRNAATDCMVIRRASDSTTTTIGFDGSGNIDEAAINTFCSGTTCTVSEWKDQSGNGNDATAPSTGDEPTIYTGGALVKENGKVALNFDNDRLRAEISATITSESVFVTTTIDNSGRWNRIVSQAGTSGGDTGSYIPMIQQDNLGVVGGFDGSFRAGVAFNYSTQLLFSAINTGTSLTNYVSGTAGTVSTYSLSETIGTLGIGDAPNGGSTGEKLVGNMQEIVVYHSDKSGADQTSIESNIGDYFTQNTPLLDTYSGAACAYSLRLLDSTYTGALINVWNGTSYADIYPNVFGELDTVALAAHCGSNDGFIRYWYDQSSNSNDATQTTTANMPKIYDGTTGVVTENGKPAVQFDGSDDVLNGSSINPTNDITMLLVYNCSSSNTFNTLFGQGRGFIGSGESNTDFSYGLNGNNIEPDIQNTNLTAVINLSASTSRNKQELGELYYSRNANAYVYVDSTLGDSIATPDYAIRNAHSLSIGAAAFTPNAKIQEAIVYNSDQSSNRTNIEDNINTFYNIY